MIRVVIADDQPLVRTGLRMILSTEPDMEVVAEAADGAARSSRAPAPARRRLDGCADARHGRDRGDPLVTAGDDPPRVLVLTTFDLDEIVYDALRAGASAFLLKDAPEERLTAAIRVVADGGSLFAPSVTRRLIEEFSSRRDPPSNSARSDRTGDRGAPAGRPRESNQEIAAHLFVTENTVKTHVARLLMKLGLRDRVQAVVLAYESGLVRPAAGA